MAVDRFELPADGVLAARVCVAQRVPAGDPCRVRGVARRCGGFAAELRRCASELLSSADSDLWRGTAHRDFAARLSAKAPRLNATAGRYEQYASALIGYAAVLDETGPRLLTGHRRLQADLAEPAGSADQAPELLYRARDFKLHYDRWADALERCTTALLRANDSDPTRDRHGIQVLEHQAASAAGKYLSPAEKAVLHPSLRNLSDSLGSLNVGLTVLGLGLLFIYPPAGAACLVAATVLAGAQAAVDATRRARGEHVSGASLGLEVAAAIPIGGNAFRALRAGEEVVHLVPGGGLMAHEGVDRGHTLAKHVGKTEAFLRHRLATEPHLEAASTFYDRETAEHLISGFLDDNTIEIGTWLSGRKDKLVISGRSTKAGIVVLRHATGPLEGSGIRLVLRRSSAMASGFRIHTAMVTL